MEEQANYCARCGSKVEQQANKFCTNCGNSLVQSLHREHVVQDTIKANEKGNPTAFIVGGWICCVVSLLFIPVLFGAAGVILGYLLTTKGEKTHGTIMVIASIACGIFGMLLGAATV